MMMCEKCGKKGTYPVLLLVYTTYVLVLRYSPAPELLGRLETIFQQQKYSFEKPILKSVKRFLLQMTKLQRKIRSVCVSSFVCSFTLLYHHIDYLKKPQQFQSKPSCVPLEQYFFNNAEGYQDLCEKYMMAQVVCAVIEQVLKQNRGTHYHQ